MKIIAIFLALFPSLLYSQTPKYLVLEHREKPKEHVYYEGEILVVVSENGQKVKGPLRVISEHLIQVKNKVVPVTSIHSIGRKDKVVSRVASVILTNGMNLFIFAINENLKSGWSTISKTHKASLPMLALGIPLFAIVNKHKLKNWKYVAVPDPGFY